MPESPEHPTPPPHLPVRCPLLPGDAETFLKLSLTTHHPAMALLGLRLRELVRLQLLMATEEFSVGPSVLFIGYSVHSFGVDPIVSLTISATDVWLRFAEGRPLAGEDGVFAGTASLPGSLRITGEVDWMSLKIILREAGRTSHQRLPRGRAGHCFLLRDPLPSHPGLQGGSGKTSAA